MPTTKKRLNITLSPEMERVLARIASRDRVPEATKVTELLRLALEIEEDIVWEALAKIRDVAKTPYVTHSKAWK